MYRCQNSLILYKSESKWKRVTLNLKEQLLNLKHFLSPTSYGDGGLVLKVVANLNILLISKKSMEVWLWSSSITD